MNVIPIHGLALEQARAELASMDPVARDIVLAMVRPYVHVPGQAEFAAQIAAALVEFGTQVSNVDAFVAAFLEIARGSTE